MRKHINHLNSQVCPWWFCPTFDNPLRRLVQNPERILGDLVRPGCSALDLGCGMGYFTPTLARLVGPAGHVIAVDLQPQMLEMARRRVAHSGAAARVDFHQSQPEVLGLSQPLDFALLFWMLHEVPDPKSLLEQVAALLKPGAALLLVEPYGHVGKDKFTQELQLAIGCGLTMKRDIPVFFSRAVLLEKE